MTKIKPIQDYLLVQIEKIEEKTASGIIVPGVKSEDLRGLVLDVGEKVKQIKKGDRVIYKRFMGNKAEVDGNIYLLIQEKDILATE